MPTGALGLGRREHLVGRAGRSLGNRHPGFRDGNDVSLMPRALCLFEFVCLVRWIGAQACANQIHGLRLQPSVSPRPARHRRCSERLLINSDLNVALDRHWPLAPRFGIQGAPSRPWSGSWPC
jgi:hypothetical protein